MELKEISYKNVEGLVSIIIPTHNRGDLIFETLDSIQDQTYTNIEVIVIDDHSTDDSIAKIEEYIKKSDLDITLLTNDGHGGCDARNTGLRKAKGEYIQFFDDDDLMYPDMIKKRLDILRANSADYVACNMEYFEGSPSNIIRRTNIDKIEHTLESHLFNKGCPTPIFLVKREIIDKIGLWNPDVKRHQDLEYFLRLFGLEANGIYVPDVLIGIRIHKHRMTAKTFKSAENGLSSLIIIQKEYKGYKKVNIIAVYLQLQFIYALFQIRFLKSLSYSMYLIYNNLSVVIHIVRLMMHNKRFRLQYDDFHE